MSTTPKRPNLFLSHAWEDKDVFVRPLAEALRSEFDVWYDEYSLRPGDSLLEKISAGLRDCDRGIVVLSHNFFAKQWPQAELNGLFALETTERKIIVPIWLNVTKQDVLRFSPILADRVAILASQAVPGVVSQIRGVIQGETQVREVLGDQLRRRFEQVGKLLALRRRQADLAQSEEGRGILRDEVKRLFDYVSQRSHELESESRSIRVLYSADHRLPGISVARVNHERMSIAFTVNEENLVSSRLTVQISTSTGMEEYVFHPEFGEGVAVQWKPVTKKTKAWTKRLGSQPAKTQDNVVDDSFLRFVECIEAELERHR